MGIKQYRVGADFENEFASLLAQYGFWATILPKQKDGSQPFDVQAQKYGKAYNFDCKTVNTVMFPLSRIEDNQERSFSRLERCGCHHNYFAIKNEQGIYICNARTLIDIKNHGEVKISPRMYGVTLETWISRLGGWKNE